jgi:hypothetical protein
MVGSKISHAAQTCLNAMLFNAMENVQAFYKS